MQRFCTNGARRVPAAMLCCAVCTAFISGPPGCDAVRAQTTAKTPAADEPTDNGDGDTNSGESLAISIREVKFRSTPTVNLVRAEISVTLSVTNKTSDELAVDFSRFTLTADGRPHSFRRPVKGDIILTQTKLPAGETRAGEISFTVEVPPSVEPKLQLKWEDGDHKASVDLNQYYHRKLKIETTLLGPGDCLAVVEFPTALDNVAIWMLTKEFRKLKERGLERVVLHVRSAARQTSSYTMRMSLGGWLASLKAGSRQQGIPFFGAQLQSPVQFATFLVSGIPDGMVRTPYGTPAGSIQRPTRERAIADALQTAYAGVPIEQALADFHDAEPGVRLAAIEANIDRLTEDQLFGLIEESKSRSVDAQARLAANLFRVPFASVTATLVELLHSDEQEISRAAVSALVRSVAPTAVEAIGRAWRSSDDPVLKRSIVDNILATEDHRYADLMTSYAIELIEAASLPNSQVDGSEGEASAADSNESTAQAVKAPDAKRVSAVLTYLSSQDDRGFRQVAKDRLLTIQDASVQDAVMKHILNSLQQSDEALAHAYIDQRLDAAGKFSRTASGRQMTQDIIAAIKRFPGTAYTDRLLEMSKVGKSSGSVRYDAFAAAVGCASHDQLEKIIDDFRSYDAPRKIRLLPHLAAIRHPKWVELAKDCLAGDEASKHLAVNVLQGSGTPESLTILVDALEKLRTKAESMKKVDGSDYRLASRILSNLQNVTFPAARRGVNRCCRSSVKNLADRAADCIRNSYITYYRSSPYLEDLNKIIEHRRAENYQAAIEGYTKVLDNEPFFASAWVSRGSLHMRMGNHKQAMDDLQRANRLNPENAITESIIAIALVRLGRIEEGIAEGERILKSIPDLQTIVRRDTLYNTACIYGRAIEVTDDESIRKRYMKRGIELLNDCIDREVGFDEVDHMLNDDDLNSFHDDPQWPKLVEKVGSNEKKT